MPYINCVTSQRLTRDEKEKLKEKIGELIEIFPGKTEEWLYVGFNDDQTLYFRGLEMDKGAIIEVKLFGVQHSKYKDRFTAKICELLSEELSIPGDSTYVIFQEVSDGNWGWNGGLF
ncbi:phenylpyruvate tautomerase MIF-related protein [Clostridium thermarum]|uniref:phenylpyruvate tautomerase MIF-related protein n=1 Tax=Clostridium thermarum TaxID=1716543 RepID=UPI00111CEE6E|nr:phenylpyruvate tautomerase MIF-related protein [Clostridium thermarum]